ncbi:MAG: hypothetical protein R2715_04885 [Ilumatobacteraceae bacterium]
MAVFEPSATWQFSSIDPALAALDPLDFSGSLLVLASKDLPAGPGLPGIDERAVIEAGFTMRAAMATAGPVWTACSVWSISVEAHLSADLEQVSITCVIDTDVVLADGVVFGQLALELKPSPTDFRIDVRGVVTADLNGDTLRFTGGLEISPRSATLHASMDGTWHEPFGASGVSVADAALEIGLTYPPLMPSLALAGTLQIGTFVGSAAVRFDAGDPRRSMLAVRFEELHLLDVVDALCGPGIAGSIPVAARTTILDVGLSDVDLAVVPHETQIGSVTYHEGVRFRAGITFWGVSGRGSIDIDPRRGLSASASLDRISLANGALVLGGAGGQAGPSFALSLTPLAPPRLALSGSATLLGFTAEASVEITDTGYRFWASGRILGRFQCTVEAWAHGSGPSGEVFVRATLQNDLLAYLRAEATKAIKVAADAATAELRRAQDDIDAEQRKVDRISRDIEAMRRTVQAERATNARAVTDAQRSVDRASAEVSRLTAQVNAARRTVLDERTRDQRAFDQARRDVTAAQNDVNRLQAQIDEQKRYIAYQERLIADKRRWFDRLSFWDKSWAQRCSAPTAPLAAEITAAYTKIGGLEAARWARRTRPWSSPSSVCAA